MACLPSARRIHLSLTCVASAQQRGDVQALLAATQRIESRMLWQPDDTLESFDEHDERGGEAHRAPA